MTKQAAMIEYRKARELSRQVCEDCLRGKASEEQFYAARRAYEAAGKQLDEAA